MFEKSLMNISQVITYDYYLTEFSQMISFQRLPYIEVIAGTSSAYSNVFAYAELEYVYFLNGTQRRELVTNYLECYTNPTSNSLQFKAKLSSAIVYKKGRYLIKLHCYKDGDLIGSREGVFQVV
ncbi:uncharacterized protein ASCRUDRAFT_6242 [Ascoidea rubescens DSM 1968]|uniref:Uncharacterized protein n=1 Tax=Ascoidea rubescens DSM 1968 TaxID=1344418 RepID=A0A1D2VS44_9ASCO|nr:hypothetical protein ASCRUDRAFT_6242 [Ascoidea rubescens DSM 1968]ODV64420.1 hypothetical protein ASCRUDRAFT_6242 [Ascoidea rubescens DSM 1968]